MRVAFLVRKGGPEETLSARTMWMAVVAESDAFSHVSIQVMLVLHIPLARR